MGIFSNFLAWFENLLYSVDNAVQFFSTKINIGGVSFSPLDLLTFTGLSAYLLIAVVKWVSD